MAELQNDIDDDEIDETAQKALEIGKQLGIENPDKKVSGEEPEAVDYEIEEADDDADDKRLAKERNPDKAPRKPLSNKEKRELRKKRIADKFNEKDTEIQTLRSQLSNMASRQDQIDNRLSVADREKLDFAITNTAHQHQQAKKNYEAAFNEGDGAKATEAMSQMYETQKRYEQLQGVKQQYDRQPAAANNQPNAVLVTKAKAWADKHKTWYNPDLNSSDEDSVIARGISQALANEGLDPKSDKFWKEMDKRLIKRGIGNVDDTDEDSEDFQDDEDDKPAAKPRRRTSPPVGGGASSRSDGAGRRKITLPTAYINTLKDNGLWDDVNVRNKNITEYLKNRKQNG